MVSVECHYAVVHQPNTKSTPRSSEINATSTIQRHPSNSENEVTVAPCVTANADYSNVNQGRSNYESFVSNTFVVPPSLKKPEEHSTDGSERYLYAVVDKTRKRQPKAEVNIRNISKK